MCRSSLGLYRKDLGCPVSSRTSPGDDREPVQALEQKRKMVRCAVPSVHSGWWGRADGSGATRSRQQMGGCQEDSGLDMC